ncbi:MAG: hypothetical protein U5K54_20375 [Cytophagales bacterium]|nr:hypothetical protein [Cytophagales bacterium]
MGISICTVSLPTLTACTHKQSIDDLQKSIEAKLAEQPGAFAVAFANLSSNEELLINAHELVSCCQHNENTGDGWKFTNKLLRENFPLKIQLLLKMNLLALWMVAHIH